MLRLRILGFVPQNIAYSLRIICKTYTQLMREERLSALFQTFLCVSIRLALKILIHNKLQLARK